MNTYAVYFKPLGALATWPLTSDTLFGAVCWGIRALGLMDDTQLTAWLEAQKDAPRFAFSQALPVYRKDTVCLRLYPRPATFQPAFSDFEALAQKLFKDTNWQQKKRGQNILPSLKTAKMDVAAAGKIFKRLGYVSESILSQIVDGSLQPVSGLQALLSDTGQYVSRAGALWTKTEIAQLPEKLEKLFDSDAMQHNQVDRMSGATVDGMLFYRDETFFAPGAGLWALLRADEQDLASYIQPALRYLGDTGLGADRTSGKGQFEITVETAPVLPPTKTPNAQMTLSYYLPGAGEFDPQGTPLAYSLKTLRPKREQKFPRPLAEGQKSAPVYKQALRVFEPGSVFPHKAQKDIFGRLVRLTPPGQEAVYQSGAALMIPLHVEAQDG
jgi:CRISPR type III-A-associated RAMP protein Csm4